MESRTLMANRSSLIWIVALVTLASGLAPMSGFREREEASAMERAVYQFFQRLTFLFGFGGLKAYKAKFASSWEPRYLIYRHALDLPKVGIALGKVSKLKCPIPPRETPENPSSAIGDTPSAGCWPPPD